MKLGPTSEKFILHWGEMGSHWGVNRSVAQIHALLYIIARPMNAEEIAETLDLARSNVSNSLRELQNWRLITTVPIKGDRRDFYTTHDDVWTLFKIIVSERLRREIDPTLQLLEDLSNSPEFQQEQELVRERITATRDFVKVLTVWAREILELPAATLSRLLRLGAGIAKFIF